MNRSPVKRPAATLCALTAALVLAACASGPATLPALDDAHRVFSQASASADVTRLAPLELQRARESLARADDAWTANKDPAEAAHLAYLARRSAEVAINRSMQRSADEQVQQASVERERVRAEARTADAQRAQQAAQTAQTQAQAAQTQAQAAQNQAASESDRAQRLQQELQQLAAKNTDRGMVVMLSDVLFDVGRAGLKPGAMTKIEQIAAVMRQYPERRLLVEGFTDSTGSEATNEALSLQRASAVRDALAGKGIDPARIDVRGNGENRPVTTNDTAAGRQQNRRVEVLFSDERGGFGRL